jgi:hypothetical protein
MALDFKTYISEWLDIQNIMSYEYDKPKLISSVRDKHGKIIDVIDDECFKIKKISKCEENEMCYWHNGSQNNVCVNKTNISDYLPSDPPNIFTNLTSNNSYEIIYAQQIDDEEIESLDSRKINNTVFYKIFKSQQTQNIYVLFSTGHTINVNKPPINEALNLLIDKLMGYTEKIVIAGHSMGCMMALHLASLFFINNPIHFQEKCVVLGSGPYKGYHSTVVLPNTKIFVCVSISSILCIDEFFYKGKYDNYVPVIFIDKNANKIFTDNDYNNQQIYGISSLHDFKNYKDVLTKLLETPDFNSIIESLDSTNQFIKPKGGSKRKNHKSINKKWKKTRNQRKRRTINHRKIK